MEKQKNDTAMKRMELLAEENRILRDILSS